MSASPSKDAAMQALLAAGIDPQDVPNLDPVMQQSRAIDRTGDSAPLPQSQTNLPDVLDRAGRTLQQRLADIEFITEWWLRGYSERRIMEMLNDSRSYRIDLPLLRRDIKYAASIITDRSNESVSEVRAREVARAVQLYGTAWEAWEASKQPIVSEEIVYDGDGTTILKRVVKTITRPNGDPRAMGELNRAAVNLGRIQELGLGRDKHISWEEQITEGLRQGKISVQAVITAFPDDYRTLLARAGLSTDIKIIDDTPMPEIEDGD